MRLVEEYIIYCLIYQQLVAMPSGAHCHHAASADAAAVDGVAEEVLEHSYFFLAAKIYDIAPWSTGIIARITVRQLIQCIFQALLCTPHLRVCLISRENTYLFTL